MSYYRNVFLSYLLDRANAKVLLMGAAVVLHACNKPAAASFIRSDDAPGEDFSLNDQFAEGNNYINYRVTSTAITTPEFGAAHKLSFTSSTIDMYGGILTFEDFHLLTSGGFIRGLVHRAGTSSFYDGDDSQSSADDNSWYLDSSIKGQDPSLVSLKSTLNAANLPAAFKNLRKVAQYLSDPRLDEVMKQVDDLVIVSSQAKAQTLTATDQSLVTILHVPYINDPLSAINAFPDAANKISYQIKVPAYLGMKRIYDVEAYRFNDGVLIFDVTATLGLKVKKISYKLWRHPNRGQFQLMTQLLTPPFSHESWCLNDHDRYWLHPTDAQKKLESAVIPTFKLLLQNLPIARGEPLIAMLDDYLLAASTKDLPHDIVSLKEMSQQEEDAASADESADAAQDPLEGRAADSPDSSGQSSGSTDPSADARAAGVGESGRGR